MKKFISWLLILTMMFCFTACDSEDVEKANDLLSVSTVVESASNITAEDSTDMVSGVNSLYSKKFTAKAGVAEKKSIRYELPKVYDMTHQALSVDVHRYDVDNLSDSVYEQAIERILSEAPVDDVFLEELLNTNPAELPEDISEDFPEEFPAEMLEDFSDFDISTLTNWEETI